jgi:Ca2+-binding RTX toxin-like protein
MLCLSALVAPAASAHERLPTSAAAAAAESIAGKPDTTSLCERLRPLPGFSVPMCSHGGDPVRAFPSISKGLAAPATALKADADLAAAPCLDGGTSGRRVEVLYAVPKDRTNRYNAMLPTMRSVLAETDANLNSAGGANAQHYRWLCENGTDVTIRNVTLKAVGNDGEFNFSDYLDSLQRQTDLGLGPVDYNADRRIYMAFVDNVSDVYPYGGQGTVYGDDTADPTVNYNNQASNAYSMTAYFDAYVVGHEIGHNIGAVQVSSPHSSGAFHCYDAYDLMCYNDGGPYFEAGGSLVENCPGSQAYIMDCGRDDYYYAGTPAASNYLSTHWNTANSSYLWPAITRDRCTIRGTESADVLIGTSASETICGLGGNDVIAGRGGDDIILGGPGFDVADYSAASSGGVYADLSRGTASDGGGIDTLSGINGIIGSQYNDYIYGDDTANLIDGKGGSDELSGGRGDDRVYGRGGSDVLFLGQGDDDAGGGNGVDAVIYESPVALDLTAGTATNKGGTDTLDTIENAHGSSGADTLRGSSAANFLLGNGGNDKLFGAGGNDTLYGGEGEDSLTGGDGTDHCGGGIGTDTARGCETKVAVP